MPPALDDGWEVASPAEVDLDAEQLSRLDAFLRQWPRHNVHAIVIARHGKLVFERYLRGREWTSRANNERLLFESKDPCCYVLEQPMALPPGAAFNYCGGATTLLAAALAKAVGRSLEAYASETLFGPLGITDTEWLGFAGSPLVAAFAGLRLRPRDLTKLGQLVADEGCWKGRQILPAQWIAESTRPHLDAEGFQALYYGYHWWLGRSLLNGRELTWTAGFGSGGQRLFIVPALDLVVAVNAFNYRNHIPAAILNRFVLPAVMDDPSQPRDASGS